jgi:hypothetical protein
VNISAPTLKESEMASTGYHELIDELSGKLKEFLFTNKTTAHTRSAGIERFKRA